MLKTLLLRLSFKLIIVLSYCLDEIQPSFYFDHSHPLAFLQAVSFRFIRDLIRFSIPLAVEKLLGVKNVIASISIQTHILSVELS